MALSDKKILKEMEKGNIVISPFNEKNLSTSSYDISLGENYFSEQKNLGASNIYNPYNKEETARVWGSPKKALLAKDVFQNFNFENSGIANDERVILLGPGETILAHTNEFIGGKNCITTMMKARSSLGRNFIEVCKCAGWGDVGYINRWTMEITNNSIHYHIPLIVGRRIGQIVFFETGEVRDKSYESEGKYQKSDDIEKIMEKWSPLSMLPKMYKDREI